MAVDEVRNTVYVVTEQTGIQIDKFDASGNPQAFSSTPGVTSINVGASQTLGGVHIAVDNTDGPTQGRIYVTNDFIPSAVWGFNPDGTPVGGNFPLGAGATDLAVAPSTGEIWVSHSFPAQVDSYSTEGVSTGNEVKTPNSVYGLDLDSGGNVYARLPFFGANGGIFKYDSAGELQYILPALNDLTVDATIDDVYVVGGGGISQYDVDGARVAQFGSSLGGANGVAVNGVTGRVYVTKQPPQMRWTY